MSWKYTGLEKGDIESFSVEKLVEATKKIKQNKAPEPGLILGKVVQKIASRHKSDLIILLNDLLHKGCFSRERKESQLVLANYRSIGTRQEFLHSHFLGRRGSERIRDTPSWMYCAEEDSVEHAC